MSVTRRSTSGGGRFASRPASIGQVVAGRVGLLLLALAAVAVAGVLVSGCGGSSSEGVADIDTTETTTGSSSQNGSSSADPAAFSACMRSHGVPNFPDPDSDGRTRFGPEDRVDPESSQFNAARRACRKLEPDQGSEALSPAEQAQEREQMLEFSACMRSHGVPKFPDPTVDGIALPSGIDSDSPQFKEAEKACEDLLPGGAPSSGPVPQP